MNNDIEAVLNLGPRSGALLREVGITTFEELKKVGSVEAYLRVRQAGHNASIMLLWAMEGGIRGIHFAKLPNDVKRQLRAELGIIQR